MVWSERLSGDSDYCICHVELYYLQFILATTVFQNVITLVKDCYKHGFKTSTAPPPPPPKRKTDTALALAFSSSEPPFLEKFILARLHCSLSRFTVLNLAKLLPPVRCWAIPSDDMEQKRRKGKTSFPAHKAKIGLLFLFFDLNYYGGMCCYRGMLSHVCSGRCASISYVLVWQGLCSFKTRRQRAVGGGQGALVLAAMFPWVMPTHLGTLQEGGGVRRGKEREMAKRCQRRGEQSRARWDELPPRAQPSLRAHFWVGLSDRSRASASFACRKGNWKELVLADSHDYGCKMTIAIMRHDCSLIFRDGLFFIAPSRKRNTSLTASRLSEPLHENAI